jgi:hypothetical protein
MWAVCTLWLRFSATCSKFLTVCNYFWLTDFIVWSNSSYSNKVFKLQKRVVVIITGSMSRDSCRDLFKKHFHRNIYFTSYVSLLLTVIITCFTQGYMEEILDKLQIFVNQYRIYHCIKNGFLIWVLKSMTIYLLSWREHRIIAKNVKPRLRSFLYSNPFLYIGQIIQPQHNILLIAHKNLSYSFIIIYMVIV